MKRMQQIFKASNIPIYLRPYEIFVTSSTSGFVEFVNDTQSIDALKKKFPNTSWTLNDFFYKYFAKDLNKARRNFAESLAGYSIFCYVFNIKDRHNGNILMDA